MPWIYPRGKAPVAEKERIKKTLRTLTVLLAKAEKRTPTEILREIQYNLDQRKLERIQKFFSGEIFIVL